MTKADRLERLAFVVLSLCALVLTAVVVRREFFPPVAGARVGPAEVEDWQQYASVGPSIGGADASTTVVVFSDFQCPYCRSFAGSMREYMQRHPGKLRVVFRHFPLESIHPAAMAAARAAECANAQGRFAEYHDALFLTQDSVGTIAWTEFARRAEVADTVAFVSCLSDPRTQERVDRDVAAARVLGIRGTPMVIVNGLRYSGTLSTPELEAAINRSADK